MYNVGNTAVKSSVSVNVVTYITLSFIKKTNTIFNISYYNLSSGLCLSVDMDTPTEKTTAIFKTGSSPNDLYTVCGDSSSNFFFKKSISFSKNSKNNKIWGLRPLKNVQP